MSKPHKLILLGVIGLLLTIIFNKEITHEWLEVLLVGFFIMAVIGGILSDSSK